MTHTCEHHNGAICRKGLGGGRPSPGVCSKCDEYVGPERVVLTVKRRPVRRRRPRPTPKQAFDWLAAFATAGRVADEIRLEREATCATCDKAATDDRGLWCTICGCGTSDESRRIFNLAAYEENLPQRGDGFNVSLPQWGCKHPERSVGKGWRR